MDNPQPSPTQPIIKKKILIVEDDFFIRDLYEIQARKSGYEVITATDGQEALTKVKDETPDLVILDIMLPKMDGISVLKAIKMDGHLSKIPCILVTNLEDSLKEREAKQEGAAAYFLKIKTTPQQLIDSLAQYIVDKP